MSSIFGTPESQLVTAIENRNVDKVKQLIAKNPKLLNGAINEDGDTALITACYGGNLNILNALINAGADVNMANKENGYTPLLISFDLDTVNALINAGADVNLANKESGTTPLILACSRISIKVVAALINAGADLNAMDKNGNTALLISERALGESRFLKNEEKQKRAQRLINILKQAGAKPTKKEVMAGGRRNKTRKHVKGSKRKTRTRR